MLLVETGKSGGGTGTGLADECILRHVGTDLPTVGPFRPRSSHSSIRKNQHIQKYFQMPTALLPKSLNLAHPGAPQPPLWAELSIGSAVAQVPH